MFVVRIVILYTMRSKFFTQIVLGIITLCIISAGLELPDSLSWNKDYIISLIISNTLLVLLLGTLIRFNILVKWRLCILVFLVLFFIGHFNILIEAYIFNVTDRQETLLITGKGFLLSLIAAPAMVLLFDRWQGQQTTLDFKTRSKLSWSWRFVISDFLYLFFYLLAGFVLYTVYPKLMEFYGDKIPPFSLMINTQFFRALIFIGIALLISRTVSLSLFFRATLIGAVFAIIGGIAPLIMPGDEFMPDYIRFGHAFEVGISNFLYGITITYLMGQKITMPELAKNVI